jgi:hypothetical protein
MVASCGVFQINTVKTIVDYQFIAMKKWTNEAKEQGISLEFENVVRFQFFSLKKSCTSTRNVNFYLRNSFARA